MVSSALDASQRMHTGPLLPAVGPSRSSVFRVIRIEMRIFADIHQVRRHRPRNAAGRTSDCLVLYTCIYVYLVRLSSLIYVFFIVYPHVK